MKPIKNKEWEKEFDDRFTLNSNQGKEFIGYTVDEEELIKRIKSFISTLLKAQKQEIIGIIEEYNKEYFDKHPEAMYTPGNQTLSTIIEKIKELP